MRLIDGRDGGASADRAEALAATMRTWRERLVDDKEEEEDAPALLAKIATHVAVDKDARTPRALEVDTNTFQITYRRSNPRSVQFTDVLETVLWDESACMPSFPLPNSAHTHTPTHNTQSSCLVISPKESFPPACCTRCLGLG